MTRIGIVLTALTGVLGVLASSLIGPFIMFALPLLAVIGFALGPLHWLASMPAVCGFCRREVRYRTREEARSAEPRRNREKARAAA